MADTDIIAKAREYVSSEPNPFFRNQIEMLLRNGDVKELTERFYKELDFGTGGMRGEIGGGTDRMNPYMIGKATQGLANYVNKATGSKGSAVIAHDSRHFSDVFALQAALVLAGSGIKTYLFSSLRSTPELSFAVRHLKATTGIVITASHNPKEYNGYKAYWDDGCQVIPPHDVGIIQEVRAVKIIRSLSKEEAIQKGLLKIIDREVDEPFIQMVKDSALRPALIREKGKTLRVVYTPLYGTGAFPVSKALGDMGINVILVPEQKDPNGDFPTAPFPNPEEAPAMKMALALGRQEKADLVMGTDPDADRLGIAVPDNGDYVLVSGNRLGVLLIDYVLGSRKEMGTLPKKPMVIKTVVTSELQRKIAEFYGAGCVDVLTGFKYIGEKIRQFETDGLGREFVVGGEESYGYLVHTNVRDKDAVSAATMTAEMTLYHVSRGRSLMDRLREIWNQYGYYEELLISKYFKGKAGVSAMAAMMDSLRKSPPCNFAGQPVSLIRDYKNGTTFEVKAGRAERDIDLPSSNVLQLVLADGDIVTARPSGTEPKIKFYASCHSNPGMKIDEAIRQVSSKLEAIGTELNGLIEDAGK